MSYIVSRSNLKIVAAPPQTTGGESRMATMTGAIPLSPDFNDTSNPTVITAKAVPFKLNKLEIHHQLPKLMTHLTI
jgi:hypothetical protein